MRVLSIVARVILDRVVPRQVVSLIAYTWGRYVSTFVNDLLNRVVLGLETYALFSLEKTKNFKIEPNLILATH